jgi:CheY-like chemotaxis protein/HPt (histidine-containing phosphotransfer) domain-containing protein
MTQEQLGKLFDEYTRFNFEANRTTTGTGLGMSITYNLVRLMNGTINVDSNVGEGTTFIICIPQGTVNSNLIGKEAAEKVQEFNFVGTKKKKYTTLEREPMPYGKVLIVDDMKSNLDVAKLLLKPYQLQVDTVNSGFEAIDIIKSGKVYDIAFVDHMMPEMDGVETAKKLREDGYSNPLFALTANALAGQKEFFLANGFDGYITKPIDLRQLNDALNRHVRDKWRSSMNKPDSNAGFDNGTASGLEIKEEDNVNKGIPEISIPGVNTKKGINHYGGDLDIYIKVLRSFIQNGLSVIEKLKSVTEDTIMDYAVNVHGIRGISAGIGAQELSETAFYLETMAKSVDIAGVLTENEKFIQDAESLISNVDEWIKKLDSLDSKPSLQQVDRNLLIRLKECCESYDMKGVDNIMDELESVNYKEDTALVEWLRKKISESDFSSVIARLLEYEKNFK